MPGIKVDKGLVEFGRFGEKTTQGLDGLAVRLADYVTGRLMFAKWRAVYRITSNTPIDEFIIENAKGLAEYALISQEAGFVPVVEPEVLIDGDHGIGRSRETSIAVLGEVFSQLKNRGVDISGILLKPSMVLPGKDSKEQVTDEVITEETMEVLRQSVPKELPGIVSLSGGQTPVEATRRLSLMNKLYGNKVPWQLSFSYG